jgi:hypothetical protein
MYMLGYALHGGTFEWAEDWEEKQIFQSNCNYSFKLY